ncbi:MAG TPA: hypothetical protein VK699_07140 [Terriglobales bacterium]|nr:hypothetical protein [Terriglobales bacterium]
MPNVVVFCLARNRRSDRAHVRALAEGRPPDGGAVEKDATATAAGVTAAHTFSAV